MPLYEYDCSQCGTSMELIRKFNEADDATCPKCGTQSLTRKTSQTAFQLKGGGWYNDGYGAAKPASCEAAKSGACAGGACAGGAAS